MSVFKRSVLLVVLVVVSTACVAAPAGALAPAAGLTVHVLALPGSFSASDTPGCLNTISNGEAEILRVLCDAYQVTVRNAGSKTTDGSPIVLANALPAGLTVQAIRLYWSQLPSTNLAGFGFCEQASVRCEAPLELAPGETLRMIVFVTVNPGTAGPLTDTVKVSGGGAPEVSASARSSVDVPPPFGVSLTAGMPGLDGAQDTQAGDHPYQFTLNVDLNSEFRNTSNKGFIAASINDIRDVALDLPIGFLGSALATPQCTFAELSSHINDGVGGCPPNTVLGHILSRPESGDDGVNGPLYNMVPEHGVAAEFGYLDTLAGAHALFSRVVPTPRGYVLRSTAPELPQIALTDIEVTLFGNPAVQDASGNTPVALFTNPAACSGEPLATAIHVDSWQDPGRLNADGTLDLSDPAWASGVSQSSPVTGCDLLQFTPSLSVRPETAAADTPTGLDVDLKVPQNEEPGTLATPPLRDATVTLPAGLTLNPAAATGLGACSEAQIDLAGAGAPSCPESSKVGTVEVSTPLVGGTLTGSIYLATQDANPFHALLAAYVVIDDPLTGVVVKIPGDLTLDPNTGQITGVFKESPQLPFSDLKLHFFGGARGELATPEDCGTYTTTSDLMPWSAPDSGPDATPSDSFPVSAGCVTGFAPSFAAGSENPQAGGFSPFTLSFSRTDGDQNLAGLSVNVPPGLLGKIAGIPLCPDANANTGTCPAASQVGTVQVGAGSGPNPLFVSGKAYLTGPYNGGPFGLVVQVPAVAGPFNLGMVSVRQSLRIDPHTAQVTAVSDAFPTILDGIPLRVRRVDVSLDRPGFTFNPTNCTPTAVTGSVVSTQGAIANVSSRFQVGGCGELPFKPTFKVTTQANTSKKNGASLDVKVGYPKGTYPGGQSQANIRSVAVTLPKALPSRLTTIQQACPEATFDANPATCPGGSNIGIATAHTPVLASSLTGPAYLVSHGGAAFPDLVVILQGEGVELELVGSIDIKKGVTSSAFTSVPDAPISSFELKLPEGPHSGLAAVVPAKAKGNLCGQSLTMPTVITGQNGAVVKQTTKIAVTGCPKAKKKAKRTKKKKHGKTKAKKGSTKRGK